MDRRNDIYLNNQTANALNYRGMIESRRQQANFQDNAHHNSQGNETAGSSHRQKPQTAVPSVHRRVVSMQN